MQINAGPQSAGRTILAFTGIRVAASGIIIAITAAQVPTEWERSGAEQYFAATGFLPLMTREFSQVIHICARFSRKVHLAAMAAAAIVVAGVAFDQAALAAGAALRPLALAPADIALYLQVMHATAQRLRHPTAADRATAERAEAAQARQRKAYDEFAASHANGVVPTQEEIASLKASDPNPAERQAMARTTTLHLRPDILVARELGVDERRYSLIRDTIERIVPPQDEDADEDERSRRSEAEMPPRTPDEQELMEQKIGERNAAALKPHRAEIRKLLRQVGRRPEVD
jgi:hypothetical protein